MKPFDDLLPEEQEPQHEELILLLQRAYRRPVLVPPTEQAQILARVRERLVQTDQGASLNGNLVVPVSAFSMKSANEDQEDSLNGNLVVPQPGPLDSSPHQAVSPAGRPRREKRRLRLMALLAAAMIVAVLLGTPLLLWLTGGAGRVPRGLPTLTLSQSVATLGTTIQLAIKNFTPSTRVALTHDIQEPIHLEGGSPILSVGPAGAANVAARIDSDWGTGPRLIVAEDLTTRYTAQATLLITGNHSTAPPHLQLATNMLDVGAAVVGTSTIRPFTLSNSGGGSISWSASSQQAWLLVSPSQGTFSAGQTISIAVQRTGLQPGDYRGDLAISSNVSPPQHVEVDMSVLPLPSSGPVLALSPALLSFTADDGGSLPAAQLLTVSNPGTQPLNWSLTINDSATVTTQATLLHALGPHSNWLSASPLSGKVAPGATSEIQVTVQSQYVLPGVYIGALQFTATGGAIESPQAVNVSLTVQPHCGIVASSGALSFTAVAGQSNPGKQTLSLSATVSCAGAPITWTTSSTPSWLTVTPASGQLKGTTSAVIALSVHAGSLAPSTYTDVLTFSANQGTQTVVVQLNVQPPPPPVAPIMAASPLTLNFSPTQGQPDPAGQVVTITNNGKSPLKWNTSVVQFTGWLGAAPTGGTIAPGQTGQVTINVNTSQLTPGNYVGQVILNGSDSSGKPAPGSPQTITITLLVQPPCSIAPPSSSFLSFSADQGSSTPTPQTITFTGWGNCHWPVSWKTSVVPASPWLKLTSSGTLTGTGQSGSIGVDVATNLFPGTYTTQVTLSATDATGGTVPGSPQTFTVTLTIPPCTLSLSPTSLTFTALQGATPPVAQNVVLSETGSCAYPLTWNATGDLASSAWLVLTPASGTDTGTGSELSVGVTTTTLSPGSYSGQITFAATASTNTPVSGAQTVNVSLTVKPSYALSGSVIACSGPTCTTSQPLPGAAVTLMSGTTTIATTTADASGNYTFAHVAAGSYTSSASGTDANTVHYVGSTTLTVSGNVQNFTVQVFPG